MEYNKIVVNGALRKEKIYSYLKRNGFSENYVKNLRKKEGYILKNGSIAHSDHYINDGDLLELCKNPNSTTSIMLCDIPLNVVYEDDDMLVINKPSGLSTSASKSHYTENLSGAILNYMIKKDPNFVVRIIGRLDKDTSGIVIVAKHSLISNQLVGSGCIEKTYYAIVSGIIDKDLVIDKNIETITDSFGINKLKRMVTNCGGKPAITYVKPIKYDGYNTLCKINLEHGRTHQIRVHMASIGHPIVGDDIYGKKSDKISHTALLCKDVKIHNPLSNKTIILSVNFPDDFMNVFNF